MPQERDDKIGLAFVFLWLLNIDNIPWSKFQPEAKFMSVHKQFSDFCFWALKVKKGITSFDYTHAPGWVQSTIDDMRNGFV